MVCIPRNVTNVQIIRELKNTSAAILIRLTAQRGLWRLWLGRKRFRAKDRNKKFRI